MPSSNEPAPKGSPRAIFGEMLRHYREQAELSREELAPRVHLSPHTIGAYETARRVPPRESVEQVEEVLGTGGALLKLWDALSDGMNYQAFGEWIQDWAESIEPFAHTLRWFEPLLVPGLLQTDMYARALLATKVGITEDEIEARVTARLARQEILTRDEPPMLWVILDEGAIRRPVGGRHVMAEQVNRLVDAAKRPNITIGIIPTDIGAHDGLEGSFILADTPDAAPAAYREGAREGQVVRDPKGVAELSVCWDTLRSEALPRSASVALLEEAVKTWSRTSPE